jgi:1-deoxy-D-xylulose-5-phosphate synthase
MRFVKPLDVDMVLQVARTHEAIVAVEEGCIMGGAGSAVGECLAAHGLTVPLLQLGLPDQHLEHGDPQKLLALCGLDAVGIEQSVHKRFGSRLSVVRPAANH